jgi:hypothetical protein
MYEILNLHVHKRLNGCEIDGWVTFQSRINKSSAGKLTCARFATLTVHTRSVPGVIRGVQRVFSPVTTCPTALNGPYLFCLQKRCGSAVIASRQEAVGSTSPPGVDRGMQYSTIS